jgi:hypothetical protein
VWGKSVHERLSPEMVVERGDDAQRLADMAGEHRMGLGFRHTQSRSAMNWDYSRRGVDLASAAAELAFAVIKAGTRLGVRLSLPSMPR